VVKEENREQGSHNFLTPKLGGSIDCFPKLGGSIDCFPNFAIFLTFIQPAFVKSKSYNGDYSVVFVTFLEFMVTKENDKCFYLGIKFTQLI